MSDLIVRRAAIDAVNIAYTMTEVINNRPVNHYERELYFRIHEELSKLPPAHPDPLTDKEQRIFLAAMGREEKVCKKVDDEWRDCREPYEDSLVRICREIIRKVKGALWTTI